MCGIAGVRRYADNPINAEEIKTLLCSLEYRGNHATGIALMTPEGIQIHKEPTPAWSFIASKETNEFLNKWLSEASMALLHTRFATVGDPGNNDNNHPFFAGETAIVHNGSISNHTFLFDNLKLKREAETDSDVIRAIMDQNGISAESVKIMNRMSGSAAVAAFSESEPDKLLLARSGSPLIYAASENGDKLWWASDMTAIQRAVRPWIKAHGLWVRKNRSDVGYFTMPDHTAYILNGSDLEFRGEFKVCVSYTPPAYNGNRNYVQQNYASKLRQFQRERERNSHRAPATPANTTAIQSKYTHKTAPCQNCHALNEIPRAANFYQYTCHQCKRFLAGIPVNEVFLSNPSAVN